MRVAALLIASFAIWPAGQAGAAVISLLNNGNLDLTQATVIVDNNPPGPGAEDFFLPKPVGWVNEGIRTIGGPYEDEMSSEPWAGPAPTPVTTDGNANGPHPEGCGGPDCAVFFKTFSGNTVNGAATGSLYQDNAAIPGTLYTMTGWAGAEANALASDFVFALEFLNGANSVIGGTVLSLLPTLFVDNGEPFDYKQYTIMDTAPLGSEVVRVRASFIGGTANPVGGGQAFVVDDFSLTYDAAVPEPATGLLIGAGVAALAWMRRRQRRKA